MNHRAAPLLILLATSSVLAACASHPRPGAPAPSTRAATGTDAAKVSGYRSVSRNGQELYCKREVLTGSRTSSTETCLTAAQIEAQRRATDALMRNVQDMNNGKTQTDGSGAVYNNVMTGF